LTLSGIVRSTHITPEGRCYLGIEFQQLGRLEQRALHDYVFRCQRRELHRLH
jgi:c-di-GMP-binding flagellar brake protein YcgR